MRIYLGVDGGGSKTRFALIEQSGRVLARHEEGPAYYPQIGLEGLRTVLARGIEATLKLGGVASSKLTFAFIGLPAYGEDRAQLATLDAVATPTLAPDRHRCDNDMVCGWAGALAGEDGISVVAGTGSIAYGEYEGRRARAGGWGELFGDEGSAYWIAREGLRLFSRMSDGRTPRGPLHAAMRRHFGLETDLDLCAAIYGKSIMQRSQFAQLSKVIAAAAASGDLQARELFDLAARELAEIIDATRQRLQVPQDTRLAVSYSGGMFKLQDLLLKPFSALLEGGARYRLAPPRLPPDIGAALYAARLSGVPLEARAIAALIP